MTLAPSAAPAPPTRITFDVDMPSWTITGAGGARDHRQRSGRRDLGFGLGRRRRAWSDGSSIGGGGGSGCGCANAGDTSTADRIDTRTALASTKPPLGRAPAPV